MREFERMKSTFEFIPICDGEFHRVFVINRVSLRKTLIFSFILSFLSFVNSVYSIRRKCHLTIQELFSHILGYYQEGFGTLKLKII